MPLTSQQARALRRDYSGILDLAKEDPDMGFNSYINTILNALNTIVSPMNSAFTYKGADSEKTPVELAHMFLAGLASNDQKFINLAARHQYSDLGFLLNQFKSTIASQLRASPSAAPAHENPSVVVAPAPRAVPPASAARSGAAASSSLGDMAQEILVRPGRATQLPYTPPLNLTDRPNGRKVQLHCPAPVLEAFKRLLTHPMNPGRNILAGVVLRNPYGGPDMVLPESVADLTPQMLQTLARNEDVNTTGIMDLRLYNGLLNDNQIARLRFLVKLIPMTGSVQVNKIGGYPRGDAEVVRAETALVIDQAGFQWQGDHRNSGGITFYPSNPQHPSLPRGYSDWQSEMYRVMFGRERPQVPSKNTLAVHWKGVPGVVDLHLVHLAIDSEFTQAIAAVGRHSQTIHPRTPINFRFLKAGMGFFADGIAQPYTSEIDALELARLNGIERALTRLSETPRLERQEILGSIQSIELPFSDTSNTRLPEVQAVLGRIQNLAVLIGLTWRGAGVVDALTAGTQGCMNALTNCADPHAPIGNEGGYQSVDAMIYTNTGGDLGRFIPLVNPHMTVYVDSPLVGYAHRSAAATEDYRTAVQGMASAGASEEVVSTAENPYYMAVLQLALEWQEQPPRLDQIDRIDLLKEIIVTNDPTGSITRIEQVRDAFSAMIGTELSPSVDQLESVLSYLDDMEMTMGQESRRLKR